MAKGSIAKEAITKEILSTFGGSFLYNGGKEIRIPFNENGALVQIKVTLTCAKENVEVGSDVAVPGATKPAATVDGVAEITPQEQSEVSDLISKLGL